MCADKNVGLMLIIEGKVYGNTNKHNDKENRSINKNQFNGSQTCNTGILYKEAYNKILQKKLDIESMIVNIRWLTLFFIVISTAKINHRIHNIIIIYLNLLAILILVTVDSRTDTPKFLLSWLRKLKKDEKNDWRVLSC